MSWSGHLLPIFIAERAAAPMQELAEAQLVAGVIRPGERLRPEKE